VYDWSTGHLLFRLGGKASCTGFGIHLTASHQRQQLANRPLQHQSLGIEFLRGDN
jgi:hypothetical protein